MFIDHNRNNKYYCLIDHEIRLGYFFDHGMKKRVSHWLAPVVKVLQKMSCHILHIGTNL